MEVYKPWDFCNDIDCKSLKYPGTVDDRRTYFCEDCKAFKMHQYLSDKGQVVEEGNPLLAELERLRNENEDLTISLDEWVNDRSGTMKIMEDSLKAALEAQPQQSEAVNRLLVLLEPDIVRREQLINDDPRILEIMAVFRDIVPK